jgi:putrescine transport system ATP-binding protein
VAGFIGSITALEARVAAVEGATTVLDVPALGGRARARTVPGLAPGQDVTMAVRPEKLAISRDPQPGENVFEGEVKDLAYFGKDSLYRIAMPSGALISVHAVNARRSAEGERTVDWYDKVWLSFDPTSAIILTR